MFLLAIKVAWNFKPIASYKKELYESLHRLGVIIVLHVAISHQSLKNVKVYTLFVSY